MQSVFNFIGYQLFRSKPKVYFSILGIIFIIAFFKEYEIIKYIGIGLLVVVLLLLLLIVYFFIDNHINPQKEIPKRKGLKRYDYIIIATVSENKWTEKNYIRIAIDLVDEPYTYVYSVLYINNDTKVYKLNDIWVEQETEQETEYSKFIGMAVDNYLLSQKKT